MIESERREAEEYADSAREIRRLTVLEISTRKLERERMRAENDRRKADREAAQEPVVTRQKLFSVVFIIVIYKNL